MSEKQENGRETAFPGEKDPAELPTADYRAMYLEMSRAVEQCVRTLIEVQQRCEELYLQSTEE